MGCERCGAGILWNTPSRQHHGEFMSGGIFLVRDNDELVEMTEQPYNSEDILQELLAKYPNLLAGDQMDSEEPRRWLLVTREMGLPSDELEGNRWSVDHLFLDQDGIPTLVEVKRSSDTRLRREVVGQLLEYAANAVSYWPVERITAELDRRCEKEGIDLEDTLNNILGPDGDTDDYWEHVRTNLQAGRIRLVFVADVIPKELRRIVEFLNEQMNPADVFALEVKQYVGEGLQTLVPRLIGASERKQVSSGTRAKKRWDEATFLEDLAEASSDEIVALVKRLLAGLRAIEGVEIWWGQGATTASFVPGVAYGKNWVGLFRAVSRGASIQTYFGMLKNREPFASVEKRRELQHRYNAISGITIPDEGIDRYPSFPLEALLKIGALDGFLAIQKWLVEEIRKT